MTQITASYRLAALRRGIAVRPNKNVQTPENVLYAASIELANLGFVVDPKALKGMTTQYLTDLISSARTLMGADRDMVPIYPGFPKQVEELSILTRYVEQILHYMSGGRLLPDYPDVVREGLPIADMLRNARTLEVLPAAAVARELMTGLVSDPIAMSVDDRTFLRGVVAIHPPTLADVTKIAKASRNSENLQTFVGILAENSSFTSDKLFNAVSGSIKDSDELLRLVLILASEPSNEKWEENYITAVENLADRNARAVKMKKLSKGTRREIVSILGRVSKGFSVDRVLAREDLWRRVMRAVHPYDFKLSEDQKRVADIIHENVEYRTFNSLVEDAMEKGDVQTAVGLLAENQPGNLLRRTVALLRLVKTRGDAESLAEGLRSSAGNARLTTLISAYNGIISANDDHARVTRVAGITNSMVARTDVVKVDENHLKVVVKAVEDALLEVLRKRDAPEGAVAVKSKVPVPLVRRDAATADRVLDRGQEIGMAGEGDIIRIFGHWNNNQSSGGYMDIGAVVLDGKFNQIAVSTWNTWMDATAWSTYSGDKLVYPGKSAPEFIDVKKAALLNVYPQAEWVAMTVQSWSGWPINNVDFIAGAMLRSNGEKGQVFDARSVTTAFKPTTESTQSVPFAVNLKTGVIVWIDSSNGSKESGVSSSGDGSIGDIVYDEISRPRLTLGDLASLWATAHGAKTTNGAVDRELILKLLG